MKSIIRKIRDFLWPSIRVKPKARRQDDRLASHYDPKQFRRERTK